VARGDLDGKPARCQPGHHRDAVRIAVDGAIGPEDDRALGKAPSTLSSTGAVCPFTVSTPVTDQPPRCCRMMSEQNEIAG